MLNAAEHFQGIQEWNVRPDTNWDLCFICQENSTAKLICPANSSSDDSLKSYENILHNLQNFADLEELPVPLQSRFNEPHLIHKFINKSATFHKACKNRYDSYHYETATERRRTSDSGLEQSSSSTVKTRSKFSAQNFVPTCFLCDAPDLDCNLNKPVR